MACSSLPFRLNFCRALRCCCTFGGDWAAFIYPGNERRSWICGRKLKVTGNGKWSVQNVMTIKKYMKESTMTSNVPYSLYSSQIFRSTFDNNVSLDVGPKYAKLRQKWDICVFNVRIEKNVFEHLEISWRICRKMTVCTKHYNVYVFFLCQNSK